MTTHQYLPDPDDALSCARCFLPRGNARHGDGPSVPDISEPRTRHEGLPAPAQMHSVTSVQAAIDMAPSLNERQHVVLKQFREVGMRGLTDEELIHRVDPANPNGVRPRRVELERAGLVAKRLDNHGHDLQRKNRSGRRAVVYAITPAGRERAA